MPALETKSGLLTHFASTWDASLSLSTDTRYSMNYSLFSGNICRWRLNTLTAVSEMLCIVTN